MLHKGGGGYYYTQINLRCDRGVPVGSAVFETLRLSDTQCGMVYTGASAAGCGTPTTVVLHPLGIVAGVLTGLGGLLVLYFALGTLWNRRSKGARGLEAVPHIALFRAIYRVTFGKCCGACGRGLSQEEKEVYEELRASGEAHEVSPFTT